ncbi:helix-hairpin-helix motif family protein [Nannochloropsis oceanica]
MDVEDEAHRVVQQKIVFTRMAYSRQVFEASMRGASLRATTAAMSAFEAWVEEGHAKGKPPSLADVWKEVKEAEEEQMEKGSRRWLGRPPHADHAAPPSAFPPPLPPPTPPETPTTLRAMGPIWIVEKYDQISTRIAKRWRQVLGKHGARFHPHFVPGKTRVVILPSRLSRATVNKLLPCDCRDVRLLTQEWAVEAIKRAIALGEAKTKEGGGEGGKEGRKEGGGLRPPPYAQYLFVDPADLTAHGAAAEEEQEQARGGGREGKDKGRKRLRGAVGRWGCMVHDFSESYFGICCLGQGYPHRRLDLKTYPREQYPFAVLYFTGSDYFNRSMRCWAINHKGVRDVGDRVICHDERGIFKALGLAYKHPWERNTHDAVMLEEEEGGKEGEGRGRGRLAVSLDELEEWEEKEEAEAQGRVVSLEGEEEEGKEGEEGWRGMEEEEEEEESRLDCEQVWSGGRRREGGREEGREGGKGYGRRG